MRTKTVKIAEKEVVVREKKIKELKDLIEKNKYALEELLKANNIKDGLEAVNSLLFDKLKELFPVLSDHDIDNAVPSEIEDLINAFVDVNFTGVKRVATPMMKILLQGLKNA